MRSLKTIILAISVLLCVAPVKAQSDSTEKKSPDLTFVVKKLSDGSFELKSRLSLFENRVDFPISGAQVDFALGTDSLIKIEGNRTDKNGYA
ncbi:MAG TPA: hypothetical protein VHO90_02320, partial [Bacteroidales bacterium]|nr:hypothetical protein [Bacteroidales bacterium]